MNTITYYAHWCTDNLHKSDVQLGYCIVKCLTYITILAASKKFFCCLYCLTCKLQGPGPGDSLVTSTCLCWILLMKYYIMYHFSTLQNKKKKQFGCLRNTQNKETASGWDSFMLVRQRVIHGIVRDQPVQIVTTGQLRVSRAWKVSWSFWSALCEIPHSCCRGLCVFLSLWL